MLAYDNPSKIESRSLIVEVIKEHLPNQKIRMFELLGEGKGAEFYDRELNISHMALIEQKSELIDCFDETTLSSMALKYHTSAQKFFDYFSKGTIDDFSSIYHKYFFNVVNLDWCSWWYRNQEKRSPGLILDTLFASKALAKDGLLFMTLQVDGWNLDRWAKKNNTSAPKDASSIIQEVAYSANLHNYKFKKVFENKYKSTDKVRGQTMINLGLKCLGT